MFGFLQRVDRRLMDKISPTPPSLVQAEDPPTPIQPPPASELMSAVHDEIRLIRTMASALRTVDRVQYAARAVCEMAVSMLDDVHIAVVDLVGASVTIVAEVGWALGEAPLESSYCPLVVEAAAPVAVSHSLYDERVANNPVTIEGRIRSYFGVPLETHDEFVIGALCVMGYEPRTWSQRDREILTMLSKQLMAVEARAMSDMVRS